MTARALDGVRAVVTGAAGGLGGAIVHALAAAGASVIALDVDGEGLQQTVEGRPGGSRVEAVEADLTDEVAVDRLAGELAGRYGGIDVVFANAGVIVVKPSLELSNAEFSRVLDINVLATFATARAFGRHMLEGRGGKLILTTSTLGDHGVGRWTAYCASKAGVTSMTQSLAAEWGPLVTVNAIAPGAVVTNLNREVLGADYIDALVRSTAKGRLVVPEDLGPLVVFLAGPGSDMISGTVVTIDGGHA